jgi:hypothetical protein
MATTPFNRGRHDNKSVATAAAIYRALSDSGYPGCSLGEKSTQADIEVEPVEAPCSALTLLPVNDFIKETGYSGSVQLIIGSTTAPHRFLNFTKHTTMQYLSLEFTQIVDSLLAEHPQITFTIQSAKWTLALVGFKRSHHLALEVVKRPLPSEQKPPSIRYQRAEAQEAA